MIRWYLAVAVFLVAGLAQADCPHCGWTVGVTVTTKQGETISGYTVFNLYSYMHYQELAESGAEPFSKRFKAGLHPDWKTSNERTELIGPWIELVDLDLRSARTMKRPFEMVTKVARLKRPAVWVGVKGSERSIPVTSLAKVELNAGLAVRQDVVSIPMLSERALELLKVEPAVELVFPGHVSDTYVFSFDPALDLSTLPIECALTMPDAPIRIGGIDMNLVAEGTIRLPDVAAQLGEADKAAVQQLQRSLARPRADQSRRHCLDLNDASMEEKGVVLLEIGYD